jgi:hypothetical protein
MSGAPGWWRLLLLAALLCARAGMAQIIQMGGIGGKSSASAVATDDRDGSVFVAGTTAANNFCGVYGLGRTDAVLVKMTRTGDVLWTVALGTTREDVAFGVAVDGNGGAVLVGETKGALGGAAALGTSDYFGARYDSRGARTWLTQVDHNGQADKAAAVAVDPSGGFAYVVGTTGDSAASAAFVAKHALADGAKAWVKFIGASREEGAAVALAGGFLFVAGTTSAAPGAAGGQSAGLHGQTGFGGKDAFVTKMDASAGIRSWTVLHGGAGDDQARAVAAVVEPATSASTSPGAPTVTVLVAGLTGGAGGAATALGGQAGKGAVDAFVARFDGATGANAWTTLVGTANDDAFYCIAAASVGAGGAGGAGDVLFAGGVTHGAVGSASTSSATSTSTSTSSHAGDMLVAALRQSDGVLVWERQPASAAASTGAAASASEDVAHGVAVGAAAAAGGAAAGGAAAPSSVYVVGGVAGAMAPGAKLSGPAETDLAVSRFTTGGRLAAAQPRAGVSSIPALGLGGLGFGGPSAVGFAQSTASGAEGSVITAAVRRFGGADQCGGVSVRFSVAELGPSAHAGADSAFARGEAGKDFVAQVGQRLAQLGQRARHTHTQTHGKSFWRPLEAVLDSLEAHPLPSLPLHTSTHLPLLDNSLPSVLCPLPSALCPLPSALCPLPSALCPLPSALCPLPHAVAWRRRGCRSPSRRDRPARPSASPPSRTLCRCVCVSARGSLCVRADCCTAGYTACDTPALLCKHCCASTHR